MKNIENTKIMLHRGMVTTINPAYLSASRNMQLEKSLLGQRTLFLEFQRYMYGMSDADLKRLHAGFKRRFREVAITYPNDKFCDLALLEDAIQLQIGLRDDAQADPAICEEIAISFREHANLARQFQEVDSTLLINLANELKHLS